MHCTTLYFQHVAQTVVSCISHVSFSNCGVDNWVISFFDVCMPPDRHSAPLVPASVTVNEGNTLMVTCDITNSNALFILSTTWRNAQDGSEVDNNRLLDRVGVSRSFAGEYFCVVRSRNNEDYNSTITTITIQCEWYMIVPI